MNMLLHHPEKALKQILIGILEFICLWLVIVTVQALAH